MLKKIVALFLAGISILAVSCSSGSTTPETEQISAFDQAKLYATINCKIDTNGGSNKQYVWAYFQNSNDQSCQLKDGSVNYNNISLAFSEDDKGYYSKANNLFSPNLLNDTLAININGASEKTLYTRPTGYQMYEAAVSASESSILLTWNRIPSYDPQKDTYKIKFLNLASTLDTTYTVAPEQINLPPITLPKAFLSAIADSTGTGRFMVTFTHHQKIVVAAPYAAGSVIHANYEMNKILRISAIPK